MIERRRRDAAVRHWLQRPFWWGIALAALGALLLIEPVSDHLEAQRIKRDGEPVAGEILPSWDGGEGVPVAYTPQSGGDQVRATAATTDPDAHHVGAARLVADPQSPTRVRLDEPVESWPVMEGLTFFVPLLAAIGLWSWTRFRRQRASEALVASPQPSYRMVAVPRPGRLSPRRWRLHLYALDAPAGATPICTLPVIDGDDDLRARDVEVKGEPRPGGSVVVMEPGTGKIWWPSARALLVGGMAMPEHRDRSVAPQRQNWRWLIPALGIVLIVVASERGEPEDQVTARARTVTVEVVRGHGRDVEPTLVRYRAAGAERQASPSLAGPQRAGTRFAMRVDPEHPTRLWQPGTENDIPGTTSNNAYLVLLLGVVVLVVGVIACRHPRPGAESRTWWPTTPGTGSGPAGGPPPPTWPPPASRPGTSSPPSYGPPPLPPPPPPPPPGRRPPAGPPDPSRWPPEPPTQPPTWPPGSDR